tara:strand:- start:7546 stop:12000 length:4455 start_codon:yes stop_codon:yes gene_type:complete
MASTVAQTPLFLGEGNVPGNLALVPSVEWPTVLSAANIGSYDEDVESIGYFDSGKCYRYQYETTEADRHFYPVSLTSDFKCSGDVWSGNYLNWATTQTIDPFRWALTGGYRVKDTTTETWLEKARHSGQNNYFDERTISGATVVNNATPFSTATFKSEVGGLANQMHFTLPSGHGFTNLTGAASVIAFHDTDFSSGWSTYSSGSVSRSSTQAQDDSFSLKKTNNDDPNGGYKNLGTTVDYDDFIFDGWIYRPTVGTQNGQSDRLALSNSSANGYGFNISSGNIRIERRNGGSGTTISSSVSISRPSDQWYRFVFQSVSGNKFKLTVFNSSGTQLGTVTSNADTNYNNFSRLYVHGGHEYYVDNLTIHEITSAGSVAYDNVSSDKYGTTVRVKVCDSNIGVEDNCKQYGSNWKPEGLIQRYSDEIRYSIFGYLNDSNYNRDGGVLRASKKYVGPTQLDPTLGVITNPNTEWDASTGVLIQNPDAADASDTATYYGASVSNSGVLNYLNKFGQLNSNNFKSYDPVSELYYTALRYYKNQSSIEEYYTKTPNHNSSPGSTEIAKWVDGFPVVRTWSDPIQYACQKNVVLGIGDVNTHRDKNLPGNTSGTDEPSKPSGVTNDITVDVRTATDKIAALEGISIDTSAASYSGRNNSAFMAGLAYDANTTDIRSDSGDYAGTQTVQTYWVDVLENEVLRDKRNNQFWLTAKYGGFVVRKHPSCSLPSYTPTGTECDDQSLGDPYLRTDALPEWWWYTNTDILDPNSGSDYKRADNFYTAGDARKMVDGLTDAFASIAASVRGAASALTANTSRLGTGSALFNALMDTTLWSGDLVARGISSTGVLATSDTWSAATVMDALAESSLTNRKIFTSTYASKDSITGITLNTSGVEFKWASLSAEQKEMLRTTPSSGPLTTEAIAQQRLDFLRGSRLLEQTVTNNSNPFRQRGSRLGDIVNSSPQYVNKNNFGYSALGTPVFTSSIGSDYLTYRASSVYVNKPPILLVGANDGMLHAFDATLGSDGGKELFAYVPSGVFSNLYELVYPDYSHRYYVDGVPRAFDAWFDPADVPTGVSGGWKSVVAITPGAGGAGVSLLDISDPENMTEDEVLWEFSHEDMGVLIQQPFITPLHNGKFGVIVTSGFSHGATEGHIWVLNIADGSIIRDIVIPTTGGVGQPAVVDLNRDKIADRIIVGDTLGNVWRFDITSTLPANWAPPAALVSGTTPVPFFVAKDASGTRQPITGPVNTAFDSKGRHMVLFGTGSYYLSGDNQVGSTPQVQSLYGVLDTGIIISDRTQLLQQDIIYEGVIGNHGARVTSDNSLQLSDKGWFLDLAWSTTYSGPGGIGELIDTRPVLRIGQVLVATKIPSSDPCAAGGSSWIMALDYESGSALSNSTFDYDEDGDFGASDLVATPGTDADGNPVVENKVGSGVMMNQGGGFANLGDGSFVREIPADGETSTTVRACLSNSSSTGISCPEFNGTFSQGRKGWREVR